MKKEQSAIVSGLKAIEKDFEKNKVVYSEKLEDIHMNIESLLFKKIGTVAGSLGGEGLRWRDELFYRRL